MARIASWKTRHGPRGRQGRARAWPALALWTCALALASTPAHAQGRADTVLSQMPLFVNQALAPLNMLVMGRDHKLYYEAYNDASDLNGDGVIDVGYKPDQIDYYGYFNNNVCYSYSKGVFVPSQAATGSNRKKCSNHWSGDFLNYLGTSRMDAIRRVLYGGMRAEDTASRTVLQTAYIPRDAHSWGKAYDPARDAKVYSISDYAPLRPPAVGTRHLFAVTTLKETTDAVTQLRVLNDSSFQIWDWVSQEGFAGQSNCAGGNSCARASSRITDYNLLVEACSSSNVQLLEASCKAYPNGGKTVYKPTGLLHDFGENGKMYFGLLTGSYEKNIAGGVLRRNIGNFAEEVDPQTGQFKTGVNGVVANIDRQRLIGYTGGKYVECGWITSGPISSLDKPSKCAMWGNPISEMMFETMRYFGGASQALGIYDYAGGSSKDASLGLSKPAWETPYRAKAEGGGGYQYCSRPVMTVLSDINPSYDGKLPGSRYASVGASALNGFNVSDEVAAIGSAERIDGKNFFIGQSTSANADQAPSVKTIADLSWARGLSPEEPSKEGTYYAAGVARFGARNAIFGNSQGKNALRTYSVAIASPLPEIRFPIGGKRFVTIAPFAKTVSGSAGGSTVNNAVFTPTNQIVDYYVVNIANTGKADIDASVNGGRPYAEFRINYEDVEQGADHDMDAIARYTIALQADGTVKIDMVSEYAAGGLGQHMGYVISGTTKDGMYLEVRDKDTASAYYAYNTPPNRDPGYCRGSISAQQRTECSNLGLTATRSFTPGNATDAGSFLKGPLWYAAKYGVPDRDPSKITGDPDNYFLVTNAGTLKDQLTKAFNDILQNISSVTAVSVDMPTATLGEGADLYRTTFEVQYWSGDVIREKLTTSDRTLVWSAAELLSERSADDRKIYYPSRTGSAVSLSPFTYSSLSGQRSDASWLAVLNTDPATNSADGQAKKRIEFLRGEVRDDLRVRKPLASGKPNVLGDIVNSSLVRVKGGLYRASAADKLEGSATYAAFAAKQAAKEMLYVGANDGMLHAFDAASGKEEFAFIPSGVKNSLNVLTSRYGAGGAPHRYFVDGTPVVSDVYFGNAWHRVLVGSLGAGGRQVFALDVTDPTSPRLLWEFGVEQDERMGYSMPTPVVARLNDAGRSKGRWVVFLSNGYQASNSASGESSLFVLDVSSGEVIRRFDFAAGMTAAELSALPAPKNGLSRAAVVDNNGDGKVDVAYAGDLAGNVWRVDLASGASGSWNAQLFFVARESERSGGKRLSITTAPYVVRHSSGKGDVVAFGTGRFMTDDDKLDMRRQSVFGIWDRYGTPATTAPQPLPTAGKGRGDLQAQQFTQVSGFPGKFALSANPVTWYKDATSTADSNVHSWGWYVDLPRDGERPVYDMSLYGRGLVFTSIRPPLGDPCSAGLASTIYAIDPDTGGKTDYVAFDVNGDGIFNASDNLAGQQVNGREVGPGRPTISGAKIFDSSGKPSGAGDPVKTGGDDINSGVDRGRQSWRRQPANP